MIMKDNEKSLIQETVSSGITVKEPKFLLEPTGNLRIHPKGIMRVCKEMSVQNTPVGT